MMLKAILICLAVAVLIGALWFWLLLSPSESQIRAFCRHTVGGDEFQVERCVRLLRQGRDND